MASKYKSSKRVVDSSDDDVSSSKRTKVTSTGAKTLSTGQQKDTEGNTYWELSNARRVQISEFKGKRLINIREYYQKDNQYLPGKKGISLTLDQFTTFMAVLPQLVGHLSELGDDVPPPDFGSASNVTASGGPSKQENDATSNED